MLKAFGPEASVLKHDPMRRGEGKSAVCRHSCYDPSRYVLPAAEQILPDPYSVR